MAGQTYWVLSYGEETHSKAACGHCVEHLGGHAVLLARARDRGAEGSVSKRTGGYQEREMSNLPSWYDRWLTNDPNEQTEAPECGCSCIMEWNEKLEGYVCPECEKEEEK